MWGLPHKGGNKARKSRCSTICFYTWDPSVGSLGRAVNAERLVLLAGSIPAPGVMTEQQKYIAVGHMPAWELLGISREEYIEWARADLEEYKRIVGKFQREDKQTESC